MLGKQRYLILIVALTFLLIGTSVSAQDEEERMSETIYGLVTVDGSYVRIGPDFAYNAIDALPLNMSVVVIGRAGDFFRRWDGRQWLEIDFGNGTGWIYARLLRTSVAFNSIPPTGRILPRNRNGRVPEEFNLSSNVCDQWQGDFTLSGNFMAGDEELVVTYPTIQGATVYTVLVVSPTGFRTPVDSETGTVTIRLDRLPNHAGTYTWRVVPYWTTSSNRWYWQQICLLRTGGTFEKPETHFNRAGSLHGD